MSSPQRHRDWQSRLAALWAEREHQPFTWGVHDCGLFAADCVRAMSGHDPAADLRGYTTERQALRLVAQAGGMHGLGAARFGAAISPLLAQVGDVGLVPSGAGRESLAVCGGLQWLAPGPQGLVRVPLDQALAAWRCW